MSESTQSRCVTRGVALAAMLAAVARASSASDVVPLDLASGAAGRRLPFDVPFVLEIEAPPGSFAAEMTVRVARKAGEAPEVAKASSVRSGADASGRIRLPVPALPADREAIFDLVIERGLSEAGRRFFRQDAEALLRAMSSDRIGEDPRGAVLAEGLRGVFARALDEGRAGGIGRGERTIAASSALFDTSASPQQTADAASRLTREARAARSALDAAVRRHQDATPSLEAALAEIGEAESLDALLAALQAQPELDPRNPRSPLALSDDARAVVADEAPASPRILDGGPAEVAAARDAHRRTARALRELRDWMQPLVVPGGAQRQHVERLQQAGALSAGEVQALATLQSSDLVRRSESWAVVLEDYAAEAERAQAAADRALVAMLSDLDAAAAAAVVREQVTATGSTAAGLYMSLDLGILYAFEVDGGGAYAGLNVYLAPVNKDAPLRGAGLRKRLSVMVGLTLTDMRQEDDDRFENLIGERWNVLVGMGLRVTSSLRVGGGALLLLKNDPNPLVIERSLGAVPYVSVSLDLDVVRLFGGGR